MESTANRIVSVAARLLAQTWRLDVVGEEHVFELRRGGFPIVFAVWHAHLLPPLWHRRGEGITLLVSGHADATHLASAGRRWGYNVVSGSSTRGGVGGLRGIVRVLADGGDVAFTPDGPRGPAREAKPGAMAAAQLSGAAIIPIGAAASSEWRFDSWDRFRLPRPFAKVRVVYGEPLNGTDGDLAERLDLAQRRAECS